MKTLADGKEVAPRTYYYLLDYMDGHYDEQPLDKMFGKMRLCDTVIEEYYIFFEVAVAEDLKTLKESL